MWARQGIAWSIRRIDALPRAWMVALLAAVFLLAHMVYWFVLGVSFDAGMLGTAWQILDPELLRGDLLRSVFCLHSQPPAFNIFLGVVLKIADEHHAVVLHATYLACGLALYSSVYALLRALAVRRALALLLSCAFLVSPAFVLYEHWLFYTLPVATMLALAALALHRFLRHGSAFAGALSFSLVALVCATWSAFHLLYFVGVAVALAWFTPQHRAAVLRAAVLPGTLLGAVYLKNALLFGSFAVSTWMGMSLARVALPSVPPGSLEALAREGRISSVALVPPFSALSAYPAEYRDPGAFRDVPVLSRTRSSNGAENYNHVGYIAVSRQYQRDLGQVLRVHPAALFDGVSRSLKFYALPASAYWLLDGNRRQIAGYEAFFDRFVHLKVSGRRRSVYMSLLLGLPAVFALGLRAAWRTVDRAQRGLLLFMVGTIAYGTLIFNVIELGENNRFRFVLDPFFVVLFGVLLERACRKLASVSSRLASA